MGIKSYNPYTPSRRHMTGLDFDVITKSTPEKSLVVSLKKNAGRNNQGKITVRHRGGDRQPGRPVQWLRRAQDAGPLQLALVRPPEPHHGARCRFL